MIDEFLLQSAVNIRREYLKINNNMKLYHDKAKNVVSVLEKSIERLNEMKDSYEKKETRNSESEIKDILDVISDVEKEGTYLENLLDPMNKEIEKLSKEENLLYLKIKEKYPILSDDEILKSVQDRLKKEGLL